MVECMICLTRVPRKERYENPIPCNHAAVHASCLRAWYAITPSCPLCKCVNTWHVQAEEQAASRARRRRHMDAGLGGWGAEEEDVAVALELSMFCERDNK